MPGSKLIRRGEDQKRFMLHGSRIDIKGDRKQKIGRRNHTIWHPQARILIREMGIRRSDVELRALCCSFGSYHRQQHLGLCDGPECMRMIRRHKNGVSGFDSERFAIN